MSNDNQNGFLKSLNSYSILGDKNNLSTENQELPEILFITSYPPRECGLATYSQDLIMALKHKFNQSFEMNICALETENERHQYKGKVKYILNTDNPQSFYRLADNINDDEVIKLVVIQHEFGLFNQQEKAFVDFLQMLTKPKCLVFHTVLPKPNAKLKANVQQMANFSESIVVMTHSSASILSNEYGVASNKITVIKHGTHLVAHADKALLKDKYQLTGKRVLSTFGLLSSGKNIETTLAALPAIIEKNPEVMFLIIGKTHPSIVKQEGEKYRNMLEEKVNTLGLQAHVKFINYFVPLPDLLEYLQLTDIYLFTSNDPNQAVSGTFSYAISCGCAIISTPIPHAREVLRNDAGIIIDFGNATQLAEAVIKLLGNEDLLKTISSKGLHRIVPTAWENSAIAHARLFSKIMDEPMSLHFKIPAVKLDHIKRLTTSFGMIQFSVINHPDINSGYTLDDNARALVAMCQHFELTQEESDLTYICLYINFISFCLQPNGSFLNYVSEEKNFTEQNYETNLEDANGRAIWALGYVVSLKEVLPSPLILKADQLLSKVLVDIDKIHSTRAMAFIIKGLYYRSLSKSTEQSTELITVFANRLVQMYRHEAEKDWLWYESYLTYGNSILPEAMLCAWLATDNQLYQDVAKSSFDFLLSKIFNANRIKVISNKGWHHKQNNTLDTILGGEQPIDISYTILALGKFYTVFKTEEYYLKMEIAFSWFLGNNHLHQLIYNPCTGGCYDGLEENYINLNQGAESTVSYLMARLTLEKSKLNQPQVRWQQIRQLQYG